MNAAKAVTVEPGGLVIRGLAVPFGEPFVYVEPDGRVVAEMFDEDSIVKLPIDIPVLVGHRKDEPPVGIVTGAGIGSYGLAIEGLLVGGDAEIEGWRRRLGAGLMSSLSVGFSARGAQEYRRPERIGAPPSVIRRGVEIVEISLVSWPAYTSAGLTSISVRSAEADESRRVMADMTAFLAGVRTMGRR